MQMAILSLYGGPATCYTPPCLSVDRSVSAARSSSLRNGDKRREHGGFREQ